MPASSPAVRQDAFAFFVHRAVQQAALDRGWSVAQIAAQSGGRVSGETIRRWMRLYVQTPWRADPLAGQVEAFCTTLEIPVDTAFRILWPGIGPRRIPVPATLEPTVVPLLRRLEDPHVPDEEKQLIRQQFREMAARWVGRAGSG